MFSHERQAQAQGFNLVIGIDEAGRGPLAGPVVAAAVALRSFKFLNKICDSKQINVQQRECAFHEICQKAYVGVGIMSEGVIDSLNILESTFLAMNNAVDGLIASLPRPFNKENSQPKIYLLVDGNRFKTSSPHAFPTIVDGDKNVFSISCASIVAKVTRDRILKMYDRILPQYGFAQHKGYPTQSHRRALKEFGPSFIHRKSF